MTRMVLSFLLTLNIYAAPTELGNGNDGGDLIEFREIKDGPIFDAREMAVKKLSQINLRGIQGLGYLKDEVEKTKLYITKDGLTAKDLLELGAFKEGSNPIVYARTFPRPHAATRFFPAATSLTRPQLIAVHIHEGLHRSLPPEIRSNEEIVEEITKVITSPNSTFEDIIYVMNTNLPTDFLVDKKRSRKKLQQVKSDQYVSIDMPKKKSEEGFFKNSSVELRKEVFSGKNLYLWNDANVISSELDIYTWETSKIIFNTSIYNFKDISGNYSDSYGELALGYRTNYLGADWGYQFILGAGGYSGAYGNPLERTVRTVVIDWKKNYESYNLKIGLRYTPGSSAYGSINKIKNPEVGITSDEFSLNEIGLENESSYYDETNFGNIYTFDLETEKTWDNGVSFVSGLALHYMSFYNTTETESFIDPEFDFTDYRESYSGEGSLPILGVLNLGASYKKDSLLVSLKYNKLLNSVSEDNGYSLTNLGDPVGRGLGTSSLSLSLALSI